MPHIVDGLQLKYTSRTSWKAEVRHHGTLIDIVPVTWTKGYKKTGSEIRQEVWYQDIAEMEERQKDTKSFVVAVAKAKDYRQHPHAFQDFQVVFEVVSTGKRLSKNSIETKVLRRLTANNTTVGFI